MQEHLPLYIYIIIDAIVCVIHRTTKYDIVDVGTPESGSFLMLESLNKDKNASRIVHVIQPTVGHMEFKLVIYAVYINI